MCFADDVQSQKNSIQQQIQAAQLEAQRTGKPLLILVGEAHGNDTSTLNGMIAIEAARDSGIKNLALEFPELITDFKKSVYHKHGGGSSDGTLNAEKESIVTLGATMYADMNVSAIDVERVKVAERVAKGEVFSHQEKMNIRNDDMAQRLSKKPEATIAVVGNQHLNGLSNRLEQTRTILYLNTASQATPDQERNAIEHYIRGYKRHYLHK
jgi:hypothetical protein